MLRVERLGDRCNPSLGAPLPGYDVANWNPDRVPIPSWNGTNLIPGYSGGEQVQTGHFTGSPIPDTAVVALAGGSVHLMVFQGTTGESMLNVIAFDPNFRGGGRLYDMQTGQNGFNGACDKLFVVPGPGGGPQVQVFAFDVASGVMRMSASFFAPYSETFRGGLQISSGDIDGDGIPEALFLPASGESAHLTAVDMQTYETESSIFVDGPGLAQFEPTGGTITGKTGIVYWIQYGEAVADRVPSRLWTLAGEDVTGQF